MNSSITFRLQISHHMKPCPLYVACNSNEKYFKKRTLRCPRHHSFHTSVKNLYEFTGRAHRNQSLESTLKTLNGILQACATCQNFSSKPQSFKVTRMQFNEISQPLRNLLWRLEKKLYFIEKKRKTIVQIHSESENLLQKPSSSRRQVFVHLTLNKPSNCS